MLGRPRMNQLVGTTTIDAYSSRRIEFWHAGSRKRAERTQAVAASWLVWHQKSSLSFSLGLDARLRMLCWLWGFDRAYVVGSVTYTVSRTRYQSTTGKNKRTDNEREDLIRVMSSDAKFLLLIDCSELSYLMNVKGSI